MNVLLRIYKDLQRPLLFSVRADVRVKKVYIGSMGIDDQPFQPSYEDPGSPQFAELASLVSQQVRRHTVPKHHGSRPEL